MPPKSKKQITKELNERIDQYKELDNMLRGLRGKIEECEPDDNLYEDMHSYYTEKPAPDYTSAVVYSNEILKKYGQELYDQMESFFAGPKASDDTSVAEWVNNNYLAVRLMTSSDFINNNAVEGLDNAEGRMHRAAQMAKMFLLKHLAKPESIYWGADPHVPENEENYAKYMDADFKDLPQQRQKYEKKYSLDWVKKKLASVVKINTKKKPEPKTETTPAAKKPENANSSGLNSVEDKQSYISNLNGFFNMLIANKLAPDTYRQITDKNYDAANEYLQNLINNKSIMLPSMDKLEGTTPYEFIEKLSELTPDDYENLSIEQLNNNPNNYVLLYDNKNNVYNSFKIIGHDKDNGFWKHENANVWRSMAAIRDAIHGLDVDLEGTKRPWSLDSDEFVDVKKNLSELSKKLQDMTAFTTNENGRLVPREYSFEDMTKDFDALMLSIGKYQDSHHNMDADSKQTDRLVIMNNISTVYENVRKAGLKTVAKDNNPVNSEPKDIKPVELTQNGFKLQQTLDRICMTRIKLFSPVVYDAAIKNRSFYNSIKYKMVHNKLFIEDSKKLGLEGLAKLTERDIAKKNYFFYDEGYARANDLKTYETNGLMQLYNDFRKQDPLTKNMRSALDKTLKSEGKFEFGFGVEEQRFLKAYAKLNNAEFKGSGQNGAITSDDLNMIYRSFVEDINKGMVVVFNNDGKRVKSLDALHVVTDRLNHPDGRPSFFRYNRSEAAYVAKDIILEKKETGSLTITGFKDNMDKQIGRDYFLIFDEVIKDVHDLRKDLYNARSFWHSKEHNAMSDALDKVCDKFDKIDLSTCEPEQLKEAFADLAAAAVKYAKSHDEDAFKHRLNDNQVNRLVVAQKIMSINESINDPEITFKQYLTNQYAKKTTLDIMRVADAEWKKAKANPVDKNIDLKGYIEQKRLKETDRFCKIDLTSSTGRYFVRDPKDVLKDKSFRNIVSDKSLLEMGNLLKETPEETTVDINLSDFDVVNTLVKTEVNKMLKGKSESERMKLIQDIGEEKLYSDDFDFAPKVPQKDTKNVTVV